MDSTLRLQRFLQQCGVCSRRKAEQLITAGKVTVNGKLVTKLGTTIDPKHDSVHVNSKRVAKAQIGILLFHKPKNVVSTRHDPEGRPKVYDYLDRTYHHLFPVGRLDFDASGLMIFTNDGELANKLLHPRYEIKRTYEVKLDRAFTPEAASKLKQGITLTDGPVRAQCRLNSASKRDSTVEITLHVGRNRIVKRSFEALGYKVLALKRLRHGPFSLGSLRPGQFKIISSAPSLKLAHG